MFHSFHPTITRDDYLSDFSNETKGQSPHRYVTTEMFCSNDLLDIFILLTSFRVQCLA